MAFSLNILKNGWLINESDISKRCAWRQEKRYESSKERRCRTFAFVDVTWSAAHSMKTHTEILKSILMKNYVYDIVYLTPQDSVSRLVEIERIPNAS